MSRRRPLAARLLLAFVSMVLLVVLLEAAFFVLIRWLQAPTTARVAGGSFIQDDENLGYRLRPDGRAHASLERIEDGSVLFEADYTIDGNGRRLTPGTGARAERQAVLFFGGSFTFGEGLDDSETLPALYGAEAPRDLSLNFGIPGQGTNHVLAILQERDRIELPELARPPLGVYVFVDHHVARVAGSMYVVNRYGVNAPYFALEDGRVVRRGNFSRDRPIRHTVYRLMGRSQVLRFFRFDWPLPGCRSCRELTAAVAVESAKEFERVTGSDRFLVLFYPGSKLGVELTPLLSAGGIGVLDLSNLVDMREEGMTLPGDPHPTGRANGLVAVALARAFE